MSTIKSGKMFIVYENVGFLQRLNPFSTKKYNIFFDMGSGMLEAYGNTDLKWNADKRKYPITEIYGPKRQLLYTDLNSFTYKTLSVFYHPSKLTELDMIKKAVGSRANSLYIFSGKPFFEALKISKDKETYVFTWDSSVLDISDNDAKEIMITIWENSCV